MKFLILSTDKSILKWKSLNTKIEHLEKTLKVFSIEVKNIDSKPLIIGSRVASTWLSELIKPYFNQGYDVIALHMSNEQRQEWGIMPSLRGSNPISNQEYGDFYFWSDENTKREGLSQFIQTCLHEFSHEYYQKTGLTDLVHWYHKQTPDITGLVSSFDWTLYQPKNRNLKQQVVLLKRVKEFLTKITGMKPTYINPFPNLPISQKFGNRDAKLYPRTKHHIGLDVATPNHTPILAPADGSVSDCGFDKTRGYWCEFQTNGLFWYFLHLSMLPTKKEVKQGKVIGFTGNTGTSTGYHCHHEIWKQKRDVSLLTEQNFRDYLIDPETLIK